MEAVDAPGRAIEALGCGVEDSAPGEEGRREEDFLAYFDALCNMLEDYRAPLVAQRLTIFVEEGEGERQLCLVRGR